jgi:hypothetical protein
LSKEEEEEVDGGGEEREDRVWKRGLEESGGESVSVGVGVEKGVNKGLAGWGKRMGCEAACMF